jgi:hypothetical protein
MSQRKRERAKRRADRPLILALKHLPKIENRAPEGLGRHKDSYVVVKRTKPKRNFNEKTFKERKFEEYLGYIKPGKDGRLRKFRVWSNNPPEDKWRNRIADKSYRGESEG